jgi:hypothetical protein
MVERTVEDLRVCRKAARPCCKAFFGVIVTAKLAIAFGTIAMSDELNKDVGNEGTRFSKENL